MTEPMPAVGPPRLSELSTEELEQLAYELARSIAPSIALLEAIERELQRRPSIVQSPLIIP